MVNAPVQSATTGADSSLALEMLLGSGIINQAGQLANQAAGNAINLSDMLGFIDPIAFGLEGDDGLPTLAREQFGASLAEANRNYEMDVQRFGLEQAQFNYNQRTTEAQTKPPVARHARWPAWPWKRRRVPVPARWAQLTRGSAGRSVRHRQRRQSAVRERPTDIAAVPAAAAA